MPTFARLSNAYRTSWYLDPLLRIAKQIVEIFDQANFVRTEPDAGQPGESLQVGPGDRLNGKPGTPARREPAKRVPDVLELERQIRCFELGLDLGAPLRLERLPIEEALEDVAIGNAVLDRRQREIFFGKRPQLVAEG